jgi:hypothetical protein
VPVARSQRPAECQSVVEPEPIGVRVGSVTPPT